MSADGSAAGGGPLATTSEFRVGVLGKGSVGAAFSQLLVAHSDRIQRITGFTPKLSGVLSRSSGDFREILENSDLIVELIGGIEPARTYVLQAMAAGKHVVTANKQLLSQHGDELFDAAVKGGVQLRFEGAVAGVVPVIRVLQESLAGARIDRVHGIVNGTTNFILSEMARLGTTFEASLAEAQKLGYAEADPTEDVDGIDAAAKMAILARLAFGAPVNLEDVRYEGIRHITPDDMEYARDLGLALKLIGTAERIGDGLSVRVYPAFLNPGHPLASVHGPFNAVTVESPEPGVWVVPHADIAGLDVDIEPDLSNAAPFLIAALIAGGTLGIEDWPVETTQVGAQLETLLPLFGGEMRRTLDHHGRTILVADGGDGVVNGASLRGITLDLSEAGELVPSLAALAALADSPSEFTGIGHLRGHETDRLAALANEINALGGEVEVLDDGLRITPQPLHPGLWHSYADHRMATAGAIIGLAVPGVEVEDIGTTAKTLPEFAALWTRAITQNDATAESSEISTLG